MGLLQCCPIYRCSVFQVLGFWQRQRPKTSPSTGKQQQQGIVEGVAGLIGNTPLLRIPSLSKQTGCEVSTCSMQHVHGTFPSIAFLPFWLFAAAAIHLPTVPGQLFRRF